MGLLTSLRDSVSRVTDKLFSASEPKRIGIYGPPNAGKCLADGEEVLLADGTVRPINEIFEEVRRDDPGATDVSDDDHETWLACDQADIRVPALDTELHVGPRRVSHVFRQRYAGTMYRVRTRLGRETTVSPEHPFIAAEDGVHTIPAEELREGTPIASMGSFAPVESDWTPRVNRNLASDGGGVTFRSPQHDPKSVVPLDIDESVARFLALTIAEAQHEEGFIAFANENPDLRREFERGVEAFGVTAKRSHYEDKTPIVRVNSRSLTEYLAQFDCPPAPSAEKSVPDPILTASDEVVQAFLRAMFDCEGSVQGTTGDRGRYVTLSSASRDLITGIQLLLLRFEIVGKIREKTHDGEVYYELCIGRSDQHRRFREHVGFDDEAKAARLDELCRAGSNPNVHTLPLMPTLEDTRDDLGMTQEEFYGDSKHVARMRRRNSISIDRIEEMADRLPRRSETELLYRLADGDVVWDRVESIEPVEYDGYIYDLTVEEDHTFATKDGLIVHNTTLANRIARDWTGDAVGPESHIPHETRRARRKENVEIERNGKSVSIDVVDTPGVATKVDYEEFMDYDMEKEDAVRRSREATEGVAEAMHWLREDVDGVIYVLDSTEDPFTQVNTMLIGIIESRDLPALILANKIDLEDANVKRIEDAFPQHETTELSALEGDNMDEVYDKIAEYFG
jgi:intein/homing endonuclease/GTPase SAR1 family protein